MQQEDIVNRFTYHPPFGNQAERYAIIREWALNFALKINELTPASREQSLAITELENCVAHANAAIARNEHQAEGSSSRTPGNRNQKFADQADQDMHRLLENLEGGE